MFDTLSLRRPWIKALPLAFVLAGCTDAPLPLAPRAPIAPHANVAATMLVTNTNDAGPGSLRQAVLDAPSGAVIQFDASIAGGVIGLTSGELSLDRDVTIEGPVPLGITISGSFNSTVIGVQSALTTLRNLSIVDGRYSGGGGGIIVAGSLILDRVLVANNQANTAGGIWVFDSGRLTVLNSTISGNSSNNGGGAIASSGLTTIRNSTITGNTSVDGTGGLFVVDNTLSIRNSIVANNVGSPSFADETNCSLKSGVVFIAEGANLSNDGSCGPAFLVGDPMLAPLADNGGPTRTHALPFGSPAIDAGLSCTEATDQRGIARPQGTACDLGALEFNTYRTVTLTIGPNVAVNAKTGVATVTGTISCPGVAATPLTVSLSQTQKSTGRFTTIVQAQANIPATCSSTPTSWSAALTPAAGKFEPGNAAGAVSVLSAPTGYVATSASGTLRLFQVK